MVANSCVTHSKRIQHILNEQARITEIEENLIKTGYLLLKDLERHEVDRDYFSECLRLVDTLGIQHSVGLRVMKVAFEYLDKDLIYVSSFTDKIKSDMELDFIYTKLDAMDDAVVSIENIFNGVS